MLRTIQLKKRRVKKILLLIGLITLMFVFSGITYAGEVTGNLEISVNVVGVCTVTTSPVNFGDSTGELAVNANGDVTVNCPDGQAYNIALDAGLHYYSPPSSRYVLGNGQMVMYLLAKDATMTEWGDTDFANTYPEGSSLADTGTGVDQPHTVYGELDTFIGIPDGTTLTDTVTVTVYY